MILNNKTYNFLKWFITIFLPGVGAFYFTLAQVWNFPQPEGVNGTINAIIVFGGLLIGISTRQYNKTVGAPDGDLIVEEVDGEKYLGLGVNKSIEDMASKNQVTLNVVDKSGTNHPLE